MAPVFARRGDEFAALVEGTSTEGRDRHARLLTVVGQLQAVPARAPRPEFIAELRERLLAEADTLLVPTSSRQPSYADQRLTLPARRSSRDRRVASALGSLAALGAAASVTIGAQVALPGDTLYPVKRAYEDVRTELAAGDTETGGLMLAHATERLDETAGLTRRTDIDEDATETGLSDFTEEAEGAAVLLTSAYLDTGRASTIVSLRDFTADSMDRLSALEPTLPPSARDELVAAAEAVVTIDDAAAATCPSCGGVGVANLPVNLVAATPSLPTDPFTPTVSTGRGGNGGGNGGGQDGGGDKDGGGLVSPPTAAPPVPAPVPTAVPPLPTLPTFPSGDPDPTKLPSATAPLPTDTTTPELPLPTLITTLTPLPSLTTVLPPLPSLTTVLPPLPSLTTLLPSLPALAPEGAAPRTDGILP